MAKTSKKKRNEPISINTIYETIKDRNFAQELWMDIISDIGNKPTYKRIKEMVSCVLNDTLRDFDTEPANNSECLQRRGIFTEISIMAYTVDRVISEFLHRRLQNEFKSMIKNILEDIQTETRAKKDESPSKINSMFENIESIFTKKERNSLDEGTVNIQQVETTQKPVRKRGRPKKSAFTSNPSTSKSSSSNTVETRKKFDENEIFKVKDSDQDSNLTFESLSSVNTTDLSSFDDNVSICTDDGKNGRRKKQIPLKKANNMILEGNLPDIYKVETTVEINKRKRQVLKEKRKQHEFAKLAQSASRKVLPQRKRKPNSKYNAETMYCQVKDYSSPRESPLSGEVSEDSSEGLEEANPDIDQKAKGAKISNSRSGDSSHAKRAKISNNKSENLTAAKHKISNNKSENSTAAKHDKISNKKSDDSSPIKCAKLSHSKSEDSSPSKPVITRSSRNGSPANDRPSQDIPIPTSSSTPIKNSAQRYASSDLYKPRFHFGSSCNNRSATAFTVFSS